MVFIANLHPPRVVGFPLSQTNLHLGFEGSWDVPEMFGERFFCRFVNFWQPLSLFFLHVLNCISLIERFIGECSGTRKQTPEYSTIYASHLHLITSSISNLFSWVIKWSLSITHSLVLSIGLVEHSGNINIGALLGRWYVEVVLNHTQT